MKRHFVIAMATGLYSGFLKPYAGTWGTIPAWLIGWFLISGNQPLLIAATIITIMLSVWAAGEAEQIFGHDARKIVIDEWAGMLIAFLFLPHSLSVYILAFFAFRFWDVVKMWPAGYLENLPKGWGVTMDDVAAGLHANLTVWALIIISEQFFDYPLI